MGLLGDDELGRSGVVANCRMNRERGLAGSNGYGKEIGFAPLDFLGARVGRGGPAAWLDLCCGSGKALIEAAGVARAGGLDIAIVGVDLVGMFRPVDPAGAGPELIEASLADWAPGRGRTFDLITCVHGLHYIGDKLGLIARAVSWLADDGRFVAHLDLANLKRADGRPAGRPVAAALRHAGLDYDRRRRLVAREGRRVVDWPYRYLGANDRAGPNFTGQPAVDSYYEPVAGGDSG